MESNMVCIHNVKFFSSLSALNSSIRSFSTNIDDAPEFTSKSVALKSYKSHLLEISNVLKEYKSLLEKDSVAIKKVCDDLTEMDHALEKSIGMKTVFPKLFS